MTSTTANSSKKILEVSEWNPKSHKYMAPKVNEKGGKSISLISKQTNRALHLNTPLMMTWGIADFCDDQGNSDGKFKISFNFPNSEYKTTETDLLLQKMVEFQEQVLDDAVENSELWWGEKMSRELVKHTFFPFLKYRKNKDTKKPDLNTPPSFSAKVPFYGGRWDVELYDINYNLIFPCKDESLTPVDFVPKMSKVACTIQCSGIWIGGKGWGLTWKLIQCVVEPPNKINEFKPIDTSENQPLSTPLPISPPITHNFVQCVVKPPSKIYDYFKPTDTYEKQPLSTLLPSITLNFDQMHDDTEDDEDEDEVDETPNPINIPISSNKIASKKRTKSSTQVKKKTTRPRTSQVIIQKRDTNNENKLRDELIEIQCKREEEKKLAEKEYHKTLTEIDRKYDKETSQSMKQYKTATKTVRILRQTKINKK